MKTSFIMLIFAVLSVATLNLITPTEPVPEAVRDAFEQKYPTAQAVQWEAEDTEYEAEFVLEGVPMSASFSPDGQWLTTETEITPAALPQLVKDLLVEYDPAATVTEAETVERPGRPLAYEVELAGKTEVIELLIRVDKQTAVLEEIIKEAPDEDPDH
jgi:hypothetical protein